MIEKIKQLAAAYNDEAVGIRHYIHAHPELSFVEHNTMAFVAQQLTAWGINHQTGIAGTGIIALIEGENPHSACVGLRCELDALPIQEANEDVSYRSVNPGVMHACGHDVHTSCLLGAAKILHSTRSQWQGTVKLLIQPGEEKHPGGASLMIKDGALENPKPEALFALHVYPHLSAGNLGFRAGQYMASADEIYITIHGKGGHAALPHQTLDPIAAAAQVITGLQQIVARKCNPLIPSVLTFGSIHGGHATNVIPDKVELLGTLRTMDEAWRAEAHQWITRFTKSTCEGLGLEATVDIPAGYPSLFNNPELTAMAQQFASQYVGNNKVHELNKRMAGEDFSFYTHQVPGCFFRLGTQGSNNTFSAPVHNAHFNIDESAIETGMGIMAWMAIAYLSKKV